MELISAHRGEEESLWQAAHLVGVPLGQSSCVSSRDSLLVYLSNFQPLPAASSKFLSCAERSEAPKDPSLLGS